jgi:hypothetical protein
MNRPPKTGPRRVGLMAREEEVTPAIHLEFYHTHRVSFFAYDNVAFPYKIS